MDVHLYLAIKNNNLAKVSEILKSFDLENNEYFNNLTTFLSLAVLNGSQAIAAELIKYGADINKLSYINNHWPKAQPFNSLEPVLVTATRYGNCDMVILLISNNAKLDKTDSFSMTALHWAASLNLIAITEMLIRSGASPNLLNLNNQLPLDQAIHSGHVDIVELFVRNYSLEPTRCREVLLAAIQSNKPRMLELLLSQFESGQVACHLNTIDNTVGSLLHYAVILSNKTKEKTSTMSRRDSLISMHENVRTISLLIENGIKVNTRNKFGETPLHMCRNVHVVRLLLSKGAVMNVCEITGKMPLFTYICRANYDMCAEMLKNGCDLDNIDRLGNSLLYAIIHSNAPAYLIVLLLEAGVPLNEKWLIRKEYPKRLLRECPKLVKLIEYRMRNPPSLKELARKSLRTHLKNSNSNKSIVNSVSQMTKILPQSLQDYILLNLSRYETTMSIK